MSPLEKFSKWLKLKIYRLEVTFSVYMFTPAEKFVFYSVLFLLTSLVTIALFLYLPQHLVFLINRAWFYYAGTRVDVVELTKEAVHTLAAGALGTGTGGVPAATTAAGVVKEL